MLVKDKMTKNVITITDASSVAKAYNLMKETKHSQLPVINKDEKLVGIITQKLINQVGGSSLSNVEINFLLSDVKVRDIMRSGINGIHYNMPIEKASLLMKDYRIGYLPVINDENNCIGIITRSDIFSANLENNGFKNTGLIISFKTKDLNDIYDIIKVFKDKNIIIYSISNFNNELVIKINETSVKAINDITQIYNINYII